MENKETRETMSALADDQLQGEAFARAVELASVDPAARQAWHAYHLIGDVLRSSDLAQGTHPASFLGRLQVRLREESVAIEAEHAMPVARAAVEAPAANDFRWKVAAGLASLTAVAAIAWTAVGVAPAKPDTAQLALVPPGTVLANSERGVMIRDRRLDELMAAHRQLGGALVAPAGYLRNATFDGQDR